MTNPILSHRKCPCCFDCGECIGAFVIDTDCTIPAIDGSWTTCKNNPLAPWATLSETPKGLNGDQWVYATDYVSNSALLGGGGCSWQAAQYCVDDPSGHRGRAWVVDLWLHDDVANTTVRYSSGRVTDWVCTCNGPRFSWTLPEVTDLGCFGRSGDGCEDCTGKCLRITLPALLSDPISGDCAPYQTVTQVVDVTFGSGATVAATGNAAQWLIETVCDSGDAEITLTYICPSTGQSAIAVYARSTSCFGTYTKISGGSSFPNTITVSDCCAPAVDPDCPCSAGDCLQVDVSGFSYSFAGCVVVAPAMHFPAVVKTTVIPASGYCLYFQRITTATYDRQIQIYWQAGKWRWFISYNNIPAVPSGCFASNGGIMDDPDSCVGTASVAAGFGFAGPVSIVSAAC